MKTGLEAWGPAKIELGLRQKTFLRLKNEACLLTAFMAHENLDRTCSNPSPRHSSDLVPSRNGADGAHRHTLWQQLFLSLSKGARLACW